MSLGCCNYSALLLRLLQNDHTFQVCLQLNLFRIYLMEVFFYQGKLFVPPPPHCIILKKIELFFKKTLLFLFGNVITIHLLSQVPEILKKLWVDIVQPSDIFVLHILKFTKKITLVIADPDNLSWVDKVFIFP